MASANSSDSSVEGGNTISPSTFQIAPAIRWCFTLNNYISEDISSIVLCFSNKCKLAIVGKEIGESGTPHLQGYCEFKKKCRPKSLLTDRIHWEKAKGNRDANIAYCSKDNDIAYSLGMPKPIKIITELYYWQSACEKAILEEPDDRTINWYWEAKGNVGKSAFIKYMIVKHKVLFCCGGRYSDIMNLVFNQNMDECNCVIFDIPRANKGCISYSALESIKNGMVCNTKYETGVKVFNSPHVFVFANFPPDDESMLSSDRWVITEL